MEYELYLTQKWCALVGQNKETSTLNDYLLNEFDEQAEGDKLMETSSEEEEEDDGLGDFDADPVEVCLDPCDCCTGNKKN